MSGMIIRSCWYSRAAALFANWLRCNPGLDGVKHAPPGRCAHGTVPLMTLDTVPMETLARSAISCMLTRPLVLLNFPQSCPRLETAPRNLKIALIQGTTALIRRLKLSRLHRFIRS